MLSLSLLLGVWILIVTFAQCATLCLNSQPRAKSAPSGNTIAQALHKVLATPNHGPCSRAFPTLPNGSLGNQIHRSTGSLVLEITRDNSSVQVNGPECIRALNNVIHDCVRRGNFWGGNATSSGVQYAIFNNAYPSNWKSTPLPSSSPSKGPPLATPAQGGKSTPKIVITSSQLDDGKGKKPDSAVTPGQSPSAPISPIGAGNPPVNSPTSSSNASRSGAAKSTKTDAPAGAAGALGAAGGVIAAGGAAVAIAGAQPPEPWDGSALAAAEGLPDGSPPAEGDPPPTPTPSLSGDQTHASTAHDSTTTSRSSSTTQSSSSAAASASSALYVIYPKDGFNTANNDAVMDQLKSIAGSEATKAENQLLGLYFWSAHLNPEEKNKILKLSGVMAMEQSDPLHIPPEPSPTTNGFERQAGPTTKKSGSSKAKATPSSKSKSKKVQPRAPPVSTKDRQLHAPLDLVDVSLKPGSPRPLDYYLNDPDSAEDSTGALMDTYYYDPSAGKGVTIFMLDTGAFTGSEDYKNMYGRGVRWLFVPPAARKYSDEFNHGTCTLSKAAGSIYGVAKMATVVIVKLEWQPQLLGSAIDILTGLNMIANDIHPSSRFKAVVNLSVAVTYPMTPRITEHMGKLMEAMRNRWGIVFVTGVGDQEPGHPDEAPPFPTSLAPEIPIIIVGASDVNGNRAPFSLMSPRITVYAPGDQIECASGPSGVQIRSGTSFAAAMVSGLVAYFMGLQSQYRYRLYLNSITQRPANVIKLIKDLAYVRTDGNVPVIYNGYVPPPDTATCSAAGSKNKREACSLTPSATPKPTSKVINKPPPAASSAVKSYVAEATFMGASIVLAPLYFPRVPASTTSRVGVSPNQEYVLGQDLKREAL
ncbi:MAG: hypothetical protein M4579_004227 [Chaenotheca gracillima]|nr:MAG: hypothetical protein M4579_004227 [Chaenotheca gracillima]